MVTARAPEVPPLPATVARELRQSGTARARPIVCSVASPVVNTSDPGLRRLVNAVLLPGLCGDELDPWMVDELERGRGGARWLVGEQPLDVTAVAAVMADVPPPTRLPW